MTERTPVPSPDADPNAATHGFSSVVPSDAGFSGGSGTPSADGDRVDANGRSRFGTYELAAVLSHYDIGVIDTIREYPRGSRKAPKVRMRSDRGLYLLKRRARGKDDPFKVAFCHSLQLHLAEQQFPLPHLIGTRDDNNSMLAWEGRIYELFEYIKGTTYDCSLEATEDAGRSQALFHKLLRHYQSEYESPQGSYHASRSVTASLQQVPQTLAQRALAQLTPPLENIDATVRFLHESYDDAMHRVEQTGLSSWPMQIVHCDWHPGNMLFRGSHVVAVIDYDAARMHQRIVDIANGALQFSILGGGDDPSIWPEYPDESRFRRFLRGYESVPDCLISRAELRVIPWLMVEALIAESVIPIAATGVFSRIDGASFLRMVERKVRWLQENADRLVESIEG